MQRVKIDGVVFEGSGSSKKLAKQACARAALTKLYALTFTPLGNGGGEIRDGTDGQLGTNGAEQFVPGKNIGSKFGISI